MARLWLTYAWKDNEHDDIDHMVAMLREAGVDVRYDRVHLLAGRRLWDQIAAGIEDNETDAWAIFITEASINSEPCMEEVAYALGRALRTKGSTFPLIGLYAGSFDVNLAPALLRARLCVNVHDNNWAETVANALDGRPAIENPAPMPYGKDITRLPDDSWLLEVWPRTGTWPGIYAAVPVKDRGSLSGLQASPKGHLGPAIVHMSIDGPKGDYFVRQIGNQITSSVVGQIYLKSIPAEINFGVPNGESWVLKLRGPA